MTAALEAYGKVKLVHFFIGLSFLLVIPAAYVLLKNGYPPESVIQCIVINETLAAFLRLLFARMQLGISVSRFIKEVGSRCFVMVLYRKCGKYVRHIYVH